MRREEHDQPMAEMSPEDLEKLRRLEEEVDRDFDDKRKKREELEAKAAAARAVVAVDDVLVDGRPAEKLPAKPREQESSKALVTEKDANAWKQGMQKKIAIGAGGVMVAYWLMSNIFTLVAMVGVVGGAYYLSGKYLNGPPEEPAKKKKDEGEG